MAGGAYAPPPVRTTRAFCPAGAFWLGMEQMPPARLRNQLHSEIYVARVFMRGPGCHGQGRPARRRAWPAAGP